MVGKISGQSAAGGLSTIAAFIRRDWRLTLSYRVPFLWDVLGLLGSATLFFYLSNYVAHRHSGASLFSFAVAGLMMLRLLTPLPRLVQATEAEIASGNLELLLSSPMSAPAVILGAMIFEALRSAAGAVVLLLFATTLFQTSLHLSLVALSAVGAGLVAGTVLSIGLMATITASLLVIRQGATLAALAGILLPVLSGAYFPIRTLPGPLELLATVLPFRLSVDVIRSGLLHSSFPTGDVLRLSLETGLFVAGSAVLLFLSVQLARRRGTLGQV